MSEIKLPEKWAEWKIDEFLGSGTYGSVYRAVNGEGQVSAIKVIDVPQTQLEAESIRKTYKDQESIAHYIDGLVYDFEREIEMMDRLKNSKHIVKIMDYHKEPHGIGWRLYIQMECLNRFVDFCEEEEITEELLIRFAIDICSALIECQKYDVIHRDIKPDNILMDDDKVLKLCDFGLARKLDLSGCTLSLKGTYTYMAPEVYHAQNYNSQADIYSLGMILYRQMNHGREPFLPLDVRFLKPRDKEEALNKRMNGDPLPNPVDASEKFADIILKACAYYPENRYKTPQQMKKDLERLQAGNYRKQLLTNRQVRGLALGAAGLSMAGCLAGFLFWNNYYNGVNVHKSGDCITITGNGVIQQEDVIAYKDSTKKLIIKDGIQGIGDNTFESFEQLESATIPDSLQSVGEYAFAECTSLTSLEGSQYISQLGAHCFEGAILEKYQVSPDLHTIPESAFSSNMFSSFDFSNIDSCDYKAFSDCLELRESKKSFVGFSVLNHSAPG